MENKIYIHTWYDYEYISAWSDIICIYNGEAFKLKEFKSDNYGFNSKEMSRLIDEATNKAINFCKAFGLNYEISEISLHDLRERLRMEKLEINRIEDEKALYEELHKKYGNQT